MSDLPPQRTPTPSSQNAQKEDYAEWLLTKMFRREMPEIDKLIRDLTDEEQRRVIHVWHNFGLEIAPKVNPESLRATLRILDGRFSGSDNSQSSVDVDTLLASRRFDPSVTPPVERSIYTLAGQVISTPGNLCVVSAPAKAGKSAFTGAMVASVLPGENERDCFTVKSSNPEGRAVLYFDTEQSKLDHWRHCKRILYRARSHNPSWFSSYCLTGLSINQMWECTEYAIKRAKDKHGGVHSIFVDGVADYVADVNDTAKCNETVSKLHSLAIEMDCAIVCVIHTNPGSAKTRGHLGSQLERKAETNLLLEKEEDDTTIISSDRNRRAPIPKKTGPCFAWDDGQQMHVSVPNPAAAKKQKANEAKAGELAAQAAKAFGADKSLKRGELVVQLQSQLDVSKRTAETRANEMVNAGVLVQQGSLYTIKELQ